MTPEVLRMLYSLGFMFLEVIVIVLLLTSNVRVKGYLSSVGLRATYGQIKITVERCVGYKVYSLTMQVPEGLQEMLIKAYNNRMYVAIEYDFFSWVKLWLSHGSSVRLPCSIIVLDEKVY